MENNDKEIGGRLGFREILVNECVSLERRAECERGERSGRGERKVWRAPGRSERNEGVERERERERGKVLDRREGELEDYG